MLESVGFLDSSSRQDARRMREPVRHRESDGENELTSSTKYLVSWFAREVSEASRLTSLSLGATELGDQARSRFQQFAANWNENRAAGRPLFGGGPPAAPQQRVNESRGLLSNDLGLEDEEEEMAFVGGDSNSFEMQDKKKD